MKSSVLVEQCQVQSRMRVSLALADTHMHMFTHTHTHTHRQTNMHRNLFAVKIPCADTVAVVWGEDHVGWFTVEGVTVE